ncbi:MAG TPA: hypothetical protein VF331_24730 [Polyangiales bacterium]
MTIFDDQELQRQGCDLRRAVAGYVATPSGSSALPPPAARHRLRQGTRPLAHGLRHFGVRVIHKVMRRGAGKPGGWDYAAHAGSKLQGVLGRLVQRTR